MGDNVHHIGLLSGAADERAQCTKHCQLSMLAALADLAKQRTNELNAQGVVTPAWTFAKLDDFEVQLFAALALQEDFR